MNGELLQFGQTAFISGGVFHSHQTLLNKFVDGTD
jgi:hypothetical protein